MSCANKCNDCTCEEEEEEESIERKVKDNAKESAVEQKVENADEDGGIKEVKREKQPVKKYEDPIDENYQTELKNKHGRKFFCQPDWDKQHLEPHSRSV